MADYLADRDDGTILIAVRVPRDLWDRYEYRHKHFGKAIHHLKLVIIDVLAARTVSLWDSEDKGDPFYRGQP